MRFALALLAAAGVVTSAHASDLVVRLRTGAGKPVADAVVTVETAQMRPRPARFTQPLRISQHNLQFDPFVLVVPTGAEVNFPNEDKVKHHVYSFSPAKQFDLKLYSKDQTRSVRFDKPGVVSLGCNIHDSMAAYIKVTDAPFAARTDADGRAVLHDLPAGPAVVRVWQPYLKTPANEIRLDVVLPPQGALERSLQGELRTPPMRMKSY